LIENHHILKFERVDVREGNEKERE